ncbi:MAG: type II toxin-antitoxin system VapC family toxin [Candidatus Baldrarchaeia archaeon]
MKKYVIDAGVLTLYFVGDERVKPYISEVFSGSAIGMICQVNLAEYYYKTCQKLGKDVAKTRYHWILSSPIRIVPTNDNLTITAGNLKCKYRGLLSLADCYALALAILNNATLLTTDSGLKETQEVPVKYFKV